MSEATQSNPNSPYVVSKPTKEVEFELYKTWKCLPSYFRNPPADRNGQRATPEEFLESMGIDDEDLMNLAGIKNQRAFAEKFHLDPTTLSSWNKLIGANEVITEAQKLGSRMVGNIMLAMYNNGLSKSNLNADRDRINFMKIVGWVEKKEVEVGVSETLADYMRKLVLKRQQQNGNNTGTSEPASPSLGAGPTV